MSYALYALVTGHVQGVWFRRSMQLEAERLGVCGWVRNRSDGCVEAFLEGSEPAVEALRGWCETGPPGARVDAVRAEPRAPEGHSTFEVRRSRD